MKTRRGWHRQRSGRRARGWRSTRLGRGGGAGGDGREAGVVGAGTAGAGDDGSGGVRQGDEGAGVVGGAVFVERLTWRTGYVSCAGVTGGGGGGTGYCSGRGVRGFDVRGRGAFAGDPAEEGGGTVDWF